jgi:hypothetical protein
VPLITLDHPFLIFVIVFVALFITTRAGVLIADVLWPVKDEERPDVRLVINGSLLLLTLVISLTYFFGISKHDDRKTCEIAEADAIAKEHFRAGLLPDEVGTPLRELILKYLNQRILFYTLSDAHQVEENELETQKLRVALWQAVQDSAKTDPKSSLTALVVDGMNDVLNTRRNTAAAWASRMPSDAWSLIGLIAMYSCLLTGYGGNKKGALLYTLLPLLVAIGFLLLSDVDNPRHGILVVQPDNLVDLSHFLRKQF